MNMRNIVIIVLLFLLYIIIDYSNVLTYVGFNFERINSNMLDIVSNIFIAIFIFYLTYYYIEQWNIKRNKNQIDIASLLLKNVYKNCLDYMWHIDFDDNVIEALIKKHDFNAYEDGNSVMSKYQNAPFKNEEEQIIQMALAGIIPRKLLETYFDIKKDYSLHVFTSIVFHEHPEKILPDETDVANKIDQAIQELNEYTDKIKH